MQQNLQHGAGIKLNINGSLIGFATGINYSRTTASKYIYEIDNPFPVEIAQTTYGVSGTLTGLRIRDSGGLDGYGIMDVSSISSYFNFKYATIEIVDRVSGKTLANIQKVVFDNDSWSVQNKNVITFSANFKGVFVSNEASTQ